MNIRPKTKRRVTILAVGCVTLVVGAGSVVAIRLKQIHHALMLDRAEGLEAYKNDDYQTAIAKLDPYVKKYSQDAQAVYALGVAHTKVPESDGSNIGEAIIDLRRYVELKPDDIDAAHLLLSLDEEAAGGDSEAIRVAQNILASNPNDLPALKALAMVQFRNRESWDAALATSEKANALDPTDLDMQRLTLQLIAMSQKPDKELLARVKFAKDHLAKDDPRYQVIEAMAYILKSQQTTLIDDRKADEAVVQKDLLAAAQAKAPDAQYVETLVRLLDAARMWDNSKQVITNAVAELNDPAVEALYVQRMWQDGDNASVIARTSHLPTPAPDDLLAYRAMALKAIRQPDQANALVAELAGRVDDAHALSWAQALKANFSNSTDAKTLLTEYQAASDRDPHNPVIHSMLGQAYLAPGESDLALAQWRMASQNAPSWMLPHARIAEMLARSNSDSTEGLLQAQEAFNAAPTQAAAVIAAVYAEFQRVEADGNQDEIQHLLSAVADIQKQNQGGEPVTLPVYVTLLSQTGQRDAAIAQIKLAMEPSPNHTEDLLLRLAAASRIENLGMEQALFDASQKQFGLTPTLAQAKAVDMIAKGAKSADVLSYAEASQKAGVGDPGDWALLVAELKELTNDPAAHDAWVTLAKDNPNDVRIQNVLLKVPSVWADRALLERTWKHVMDLTGEEGINWKIGKARWLLSGADKVQDSHDAIHLLQEVISASPNLPEPRLLQAQAYENINNMPAAIEQLQKAVAESAQPVYLYNLMRLLHDTGSYDDARAVASRLASLPEIPADYCRAASSIMSKQGDNDLAIELLDKIPGNVNDSTRDGMKAYLSWRQGNVAEAQQEYLKLLSEPSLDLSIIRSGADFFASRRDMVNANRYLALLDNLKNSPGTKDLTIAWFDEKYINAATAENQYVAATHAASNDPQTWTQLAGFYLRTGHLAQAGAAAKNGLRVAPDNADLLALSDLSVKLADLPQTQDIKALVMLLSRSPQDAPAHDTLNILIGAAKTHADPAVTLNQLQDLLTKDSQFLPLYAITVERLLSSGQTDQALRLANTAMENVPNSADAARLATLVYNFMGRWQDMNVTAQKWHARSLDQPMDADIALAMSYIGMGEPNQALSALQGYDMAQATAHSEDNTGLIGAYCDALLTAGRFDDAAALLGPMAKQSAKWRNTWLELTLLSNMDAAASTAWLQRVTPMIPSDSLSEQKHLAETWYGIALRRNDPPAFANVIAIIKPWAEKPDATADTVMMLASAQDLSGDANDAAASYRKVLALNPSNLDALNNLASLLLKRGDPNSLAEAEPLAVRAVQGAAGAPNYGPYCDTLAHIYLLEGKKELAVQFYTKAHQAQPTDVNVLLGLADALAETGASTDALSDLQQVQDMLHSHGENLSPNQQAHINAIRDTIKRNDASPATTGTN